VHITLGAVHNPTFGKQDHHDETDLDDPDPR
jgi:5-carboxymethyl-2-hydroxymuconic-semialdehyde dehydrogenase